MPEIDANLTPMVRQYLEIKEKNRDALLFYRIGDFYEMFFDDAVVASKALNITLTSRNKNEPHPVPLCGVPYHAVRPYIARLIAQGFRVAICDQVEDPKTAKGVVKREVTRVVTPGLDLASEGLANYLAVVVPGGARWGVAFLELGTGDFRVAEMAEEEVREELARRVPREILLPERCRELRFAQGVVHTLPDWVFRVENARHWLTEQFQTATLAGFDVEEFHEGLMAAGAVLHYVRETQKVERLPHVTVLRRYERRQFMYLGEETRRHLDLDGLVTVLDKTKTVLGRRKLREWLYFPLIDRLQIEERQEAVAELAVYPAWCPELQEALSEIYDLERLCGRLSLGTVNARDLASLAQSLAPLPEVAKTVGQATSPLLQGLASSWDLLQDLKGLIDGTLQSDPPLTVREGGMIREGFSKELDELRNLRSNSRGAMAVLEERLRARTGIGSLKIRFNQVFGYFIEVTSTHLQKVPPDFIRKQTLANAERYITTGLKELEDKVLGAEERIKTLEYQLFVELRDRCGAFVPRVQLQASRVATLDTLVSLALVATQNHYVRPRLVDSETLDIREGRHPLVEQTLPPGSFVPNDVSLDPETCRLLLITGPNMAGKSTIMRQTALIVLLAQMGSFVPAREATIGLVDRIFTRVGADDRLALGESTFMVEMSETARILNYATSRSLIILDEIGRGTSTFDGLSIAWAVAEHLHDQLRSRTLFATHYHELIALAPTHPRIRNANVAVQEERGHITFLYRLVEGGASHSYGIHVAKLAGLPPAVVTRAEQVLRVLEKKKRVTEDPKNSDQGELF